jgi:hypothetical protein
MANFQFDKTADCRAHVSCNEISPSEKTGNLQMSGHFSCLTQETASYLLVSRYPEAEACVYNVVKNKAILRHFLTPY